MAYWYFPSNDHGENKGINDTGVATFRGTPLKSLAREICQNSLDAATDKTVRVDFSNFDISFFVGCREISHISIVKNNGMLEVISKTSKFNEKQAIICYRRIAKNMSINKAQINIILLAMMEMVELFLFILILIRLRLICFLTLYYPFTRITIKQND